MMMLMCGAEINGEDRQRRRLGRSVGDVCELMPTVIKDCENSFQFAGWRIEFSNVNHEINFIIKLWMSCVGGQSANNCVLSTSSFVKWPLLAETHCAGGSCFKQLNSLLYAPPPLHRGVVNTILLEKVHPRRSWETRPFKWYISAHSPVCVILS